MSLIVFDFQCMACGNLERDKYVKRSEVDDQRCDCTGKMKKLPAAPKLDIAGMARAGCPGAYETVGDQITKRHKDAGQ